MTADEIAGARGLLRARLEELLTPGQLACYDGYQARLAGQIRRRDPAPLAMSAEERAVFALIEADSAARALRARLDILTRVELPPQ
ncbi:MAG TPA: hypothetical protein PKD53_17985 [Chloroflexaceae bacterium]|nr:hypothetical protein [Chloroflexaceae bacterium]